MSVIYVVLPIALLIAVAAVIAFVWAVRSGQLDDLETPALRMLHDDEPGSDGPDQDDRTAAPPAAAPHPADEGGRRPAP